MRRILIVDDQVDDFAEAFRALFPGDSLSLARSGGEALVALEQDDGYDAVILDIRMPAEFGHSQDEEGLAVLARLQEDWPDLPVILLSVVSDLETVVRGMHLGAYWYLEKPPDAGRLRHLVDRCAERRRAAASTQSLRALVDVRDTITPPPVPTERRGLGDMVGGSPSMRALYDLIERGARTTATVLVLGETGAGKELVARAVHDRSPRAGGPFVPVSCPALPESLLETELFGHVEGAFTDARADRTGAFEQADGGTLFLDEVGDLPLPLQAKLLRVLETGEVLPVGAEERLHVDVRIVAATNADLREMVAAGDFRQDLFYRLNVIPVALPPLRDRLEDLPAIAVALLRRLAPGRPDLALTGEALARLAAHAWPGNVRELRNVLERAAALTAGDRIGVADLVLEQPGEAPAPIAPDIVAETMQRALAGHPYPGKPKQFRDEHGEENLRELLTRAVRFTADVKRAGALLGFIGHETPRQDFQTLRYWMKKLGISRRKILAGE